MQKEKPVEGLEKKMAPNGKADIKCLCNRNPNMITFCSGALNQARIKKPYFQPKSLSLVISVELCLLPTITNASHAYLSLSTFLLIGSIFSVLVSLVQRIAQQSQSLVYFD